LLKLIVTDFTENFNTFLKKIEYFDLFFADKHKILCFYGKSD